MTKRILAVTSGRADASPMAPVVEALRARGCEVAVVDALGDEFPREEYLGLLLGDRWEIAAAALGMVRAGRPIAHIHGGERTLGSVDDKYRDAITMLSDYRSVAAGEFKQRVLDMQVKRHVYLVGAPGLDNVARIMAELAIRTLYRDYFVLTYHPCKDADVRPVLQALDRFPDHRVIWTGVNNDPGADLIKDQVLSWGKADVRADLDPDDYLRLARGAVALVGNSSAAIIEGPALRVPSVDVGDRQKGRPAGPSVRRIPQDADEIEWAIEASLRFASGPGGSEFANPYGGPGASDKIADIIAALEL